MKLVSVLILLATVLSFSLTSCRKTTRRYSATTIEDNTIVYDYVRGIYGGEICGSYWVGDARLVLPAGVLDTAPSSRLLGLTLIVGSTFSFYITETQAGELCVIDRPYELLGQVAFSEPGHLAVVSLAALEAMDGLENILTAGVVVEIDPEECNILRMLGSHFEIGSVRINLGRVD